jgi:L-alanine-DL-glutamate epimerase-like enolase superfamily enzyme
VVSSLKGQTTGAHIASVDAFAMVYPTIGRFKFFEGPKGRPAGRAAVLIKMTAEGGAVGWGQSVPVPTWSYETLETAYSTITRYLAPELIGQDVFDAAAIGTILR